MAQQKYYTILTEVGKSKIANATVLNEKVQFSKMHLGDGGGSQYEPHEKQTELKNKVWEGSISNVKVDENNPNWIVVETAIPGNSGGFTVREVGLFDDSGELLAIGKYPETYKPVVDDGCVKDLFVRVILMVVNTSAITLKIDPTVILASIKDLNDLRKEVSAKIDTAKTELNSKIDEVRSDLDSIELTAEKVSVKDVENNFASVNTEGVLQELAGKDNSLDAKIVSTKSDLTNQFDHFTGEIDNLKQSVSNGKELIATAVTGKDVPTNGSDSFQNMADNIDSIKTKLPILEGDAGVTEDSEGNVYSVKEIREEIMFTETPPHEKIWEKTGRSNTNSIIGFDNNGNAWYKYSDYLYKIDKEGNTTSSYPWVSSQSADPIFDTDDGSYYYTYKGSSTYYFYKIDSTGNQVYRMSASNMIDGLALDSNKNIIIITYKKISKYDVSGKLVFTVDTNLSSTKVCVDSYNNIYVINSSGGIDIYDVNGKFFSKLTISDLTAKYIKISSEDELVISCSDCFIRIADTNKKVKGIIDARWGDDRYPVNIDIINDAIYFMFSGNTDLPGTIASRLYKYDMNGNIKWVLGQNGIDGYALTKENDLYVSANRRGYYPGNMYLYKEKSIVNKIAILEEREV